MSLDIFAAKKKSGEKISMVTCYDHWSAQLIDQSPVDAILVGDSLAMVMYGETSTLTASLEMMRLHTKAVAQGLKSKPLISDLPFLSYRKGLKPTMDAVETLMRAGAHGLKLEGLLGNEDLIRHIVQSGVPIMGHLGLTPQSLHQLGGYKVQGRSPEAGRLIMDHAKKLQDLGCFSIVLECLPQELAKQISLELSIPTIGIGAGADTDGQILVLHDLLGLNVNFKPKFVRHFAKLDAPISSALEEFHQKTLNGSFPSNGESYS